MKVSDLWGRYGEYTRDVTEHSRKLAFAGLALCWIFKDNSNHFPFSVLLALLFFLAYSIADILQPLLGALTLKKFLENEERTTFLDTGFEPTEVTKPRRVDRPAFVLFVVKVILLGCAFICLITHVASLALS